MDPLSITASLVSLVSLGGTIITFQRHAEKCYREMQRQLEEYDVLCLILRESGRQIREHGRPSETVEALMLTCAQRHSDFDRSMISLRRAIEPRRSFKIISTADDSSSHQRRPRYSLLLRAMLDQRKREMAFQGFRDAVLMLRDMGNR
jgi:hypothetical protein